MFVIKYRWFFIALSALMVLASLTAIWRYGLNLGTDFRGGTIMEVSYLTARPEAPALEQALADLDLGKVAIQSVAAAGGEGEAAGSGFLLRFKNISEETHAQAFAKLQTLGQLTEVRFSSVGPALGRELARKGLFALVLVVILIIAYIAFAFRSVSRPVSSWIYGLIAILALIHDVTIPAGVFALLGHFRGVEVDALFLTALLTILGLSVNDTIVVFDRIRENLRRRTGKRFGETVGDSLNQTFIRSLNTSLTVILSLVVLFFVGSESTRWFALALAIGMVVGTYSSIFLASPLLVMWEKARSNRLSDAKR